MSNYKILLKFIIALAMACSCMQQVEAVTYVTDTGGGAYDEGRSAINLAPAIALGTVVIVAVIAIAVQNSHSHSSSSSSHSHYGSSSSRSCSDSYSSNPYSFSSSR
jgi:hypothetical protein